MTVHTWLSSATEEWLPMIETIRFGSASGDRISNEVRMSDSWMVAVFSEALIRINMRLSLDEKCGGGLNGLMYCDDFNTI